VTQMALEGLGGSGRDKMGWSGFIFGSVGPGQGVEEGNRGWKGAATLTLGEPQGSLPT
jgi:hypothetical protein